MRRPSREFLMIIKQAALLLAVVALFIAPFALFVHTGEGWSFFLYVLEVPFIFLLSALEE